MSIPGLDFSSLTPWVVQHNTGSPGTREARLGHRGKGPTRASAPLGKALSGIRECPVPVHGALGSTRPNQFVLDGVVSTNFE